MGPISLINRHSSPKVMPDKVAHEHILQLIQAGVCACDHGNLKPFRFILIEGKNRERLGYSMALAQKEREPSTDENILKKIRNKPLRAPSLISVIYSPKKSDRIPSHEQRTSAGCAAQMIVSEAYLMGLGAMWRTGNNIYTKHVAKELRLKLNEEVIGIIYLGKSEIKNQKKRNINIDQFFEQLN